MFLTPHPVILVRDGYQKWLYETITHYLNQHPRKEFCISPRQSEQEIQNILQSMQNFHARPKVLHMTVDESMLTHPSWPDLERTLRGHQESELALIIHCKASFQLPLKFVAWVQFIVISSQETLLCPSSHYLCLDIAMNTFTVILPAAENNALD